MEADVVRRILILALLAAWAPSAARAQSDITGEWAPLFHEDQVDRVPGLGADAAGLRQHLSDERLRLRAWTREHGEDHPDIADWVWPY